MRRGRTAAAVGKHRKSFLYWGYRCVIDEIDYIGLVSRWAHILAGVTAVGGAIFARFAMLPAVDTLESTQRESVLARVRQRWSKVLAASILLLLASGLFNIVTSVQKYDLPPLYHALFGVKFLLALAVFGLASVLAGRSHAAVKLRANHRRWGGVIVVLGLTVVLLSSVLRFLPHPPKAAAPPPPAETPAD